MLPKEDVAEVLDEINPIQIKQDLIDKLLFSATFTEDLPLTYPPSILICTQW